MSQDSDLAFVTTKGTVFDHFSRKVTSLGKEYGLDLPYATEGRHIAATASLDLPDIQRKQVAVAMSH